MSFWKYLRVVWLPALILAAGCGAVIDLADDREWRWGTFGGVDFVSPAKLRVGVVPFTDEVGLGAPEAGGNLAVLMAEELAKDDRLVVVPVDQVQNVMAGLGYYGQLTPRQVAELGAALRLNAVVTGSVSEIRKYSLRKGWRRAARIFTSQRQYVDAVLAVSAVEAQTGIILASRANTGEYDGGAGEKDFFEAGGTADKPSQEALETSLDEALKEAFYRTRQGLAALPFKAVVASADGGGAVINFGADVGLKEGTFFSKLEVIDTITNTIGETYQVMGAAVARLKVTGVSDASATLEILEGTVSPGDIIQAADN
jgi:hypothetical protein